MATAEMELHRGNGTHLAPALPPSQLSREQVDLLKVTICKGATDNELTLFVNQCNRTGLDPFVRQIHAVKRWNAKERREEMSIQVGIDGLRLIADRTGNYAPGADAMFECDGQGNLLRATAFVKKWSHGEWHEVASSAFYGEYAQRTRDGEVTSMWKTLAHVMLEKCAEARALRKAFPQETSGLYIREEMMQADAADVRTPDPDEDTRVTRDGTRREERTRAQERDPARPVPSRAELAEKAPACSNCGRAMTSAQVTLSLNKYGEKLCVNCQKDVPASLRAVSTRDEEDVIEGQIEGDPFQGEQWEETGRNVDPALMEVPAAPRKPAPSALEQGA